MTDTQILAELDRDRDEQSRDFSAEQRRVSELVEQLADRGGLPALVARYADARNPSLARSVAFQLAGAAVPEREEDVSPLVFDMVARLRTDDPGTRTCLLTAIQRLMMSDRVPATLPAPAYRFLLESLDYDDLVQGGVAQVVSALHAHGRLDALPVAQIAELRARLWALRDTSDELLASLLRGVDDFFLDTGRIAFAIPVDTPTDALLADLAALARQPLVKERYDRAWAIMRVVAARVGGLDRLVESFADSPSPVLARTLTLVIARTARNADLRETHAPLVWREMASLRTDDAKTRTNLLDALEFLLMSRDTRAFVSAPPPRLVPFLLACLGHSDARVRVAAAHAVAGLHAYDYLELLPATDQARLRDAVRTARARADGEEAQRLGESLAMLART